MSAQGEKNQLIKPSETPAVSEKTESEISDEKDNVKEDEKADISISEHQSQNHLIKFNIVLCCVDGSELYS